MSQILDNPAGLLAALDRGESLPAHWYTDPSITERRSLKSSARPGTISGRSAR